MTHAVAEAVTTGEWGPPVVVICPQASVIPEPCDCGFVGEWEWRFVYTFHDSGHRRTDRIIRRDRANGWPARANETGHYVMSGRDERCPGCGDIERFDMDGNEVARFAEHAKVIVSMKAWQRPGQE